MALEEEISQDKFESEYHKAVVNLLFTGNWLHHIQATRMKPHRITPEQFNVLRILRGSYPRPLMLAGIACRMLDKSSNATRLVEKLRVKGLVTREVCKTNRRQADIAITSKGLTFLDRVEKDLGSWKESMKNLSRSEVAELNRLLDRLRG